MARPKKKRNLNHEIQCHEFVPLTAVCLENIHISKDEIEAIKLHDLLGLDQVQASKKMQVSQSTFHRTLLSGRKKLADALINVKAIKIHKE
jgi:predicted DNA-binding protein (UPF0251 family)